MKIAYFPKYTALNAGPVLRAFIDGCTNAGIDTVANSMDADAAVIWSVLWNGKMRANKSIYDHYRSQNKPVFIIEVGTLKRGITWKVSVNNITRDGIYANSRNLTPGRANALGIQLSPFEANRSDSILLTLQHTTSLQWQTQPTVQEWVDNAVQQIRNNTDRPIIVRPHPRCPVHLNTNQDVSIETPERLTNTYDSFDLNVNHHCVVNHNSGTTVLAAIAGTPIICDISSLAFPVANSFADIDNPISPDRSEWFEQLLHTEWLVDEISNGIPLRRLLDEI